MIIREMFTACLFSLILLWLQTIIETQRIYSLVTDLEPLLETQKHVIMNLENIIVTRKNRWEFIKRELRRFKMEHKKAKIDVELYLHNVINSFKINKRMSHDLAYIKNIIDKTKYKRNKTLKYPTYVDLDEAARVILRLQRVYRLDVTQLADGLLQASYNGGGRTFKEHFVPMTASDCFAVGKVVAENKFYKRSFPWYLEALRVYRKENLSLDLSEADIVQAISNGYEALNDSAQYIVWTQRLLDLKPNYDRQRITDLEVMLGIHQLRFNKNYWKTKLPGHPHNEKKKQKRNEKKNLSEETAKRKAFQTLCRGELLVGHNVAKRLKCWYFSGHHPFTRLAPFKAEQLFVQPYIFLIHNTVSDAEIQTIKDMALPHLRQIPTQYADKTTTMHIRLSKGTEFNALQEGSVSQVIQRVSDMTGLLATSHPLGVSNYGVGGHYIIHIDSTDLVDKNTLNKKKVKPENIDGFINYMSQFYRIATVLLYLSNVEQGGATVFPVLGLTVFPEKGAALIWPNLLPSGEADLLTQHGACPVLRGSKWVATKWINGANQELRRPCTEKYVSRKPKYVPTPVPKYSMCL